jgi:SAM-dependent methyltransferase
LPWDDCGGPAVDAEPLALDELSARPGWRVLDAGCGTGVSTCELGRRVAPGGHVVGVDIARSMVDRTRLRALAAGLDNVHTVHGDIQQLAFQARSFSAIYSRYVLPFLSDPVECFGQFRRALCQNGVLVVVSFPDVWANDWTFLGLQAMVAVVGGQVRRTAGRRAALPRWPVNRLRGALEEAGLRDVAVRAETRWEEVRVDDLHRRVEHSARAGFLRELVMEADEATQKRVGEQLHEILARRASDGAVRLRTVTIIGRASA